MFKSNLNHGLMLASALGSLLNRSELALLGEVASLLKALLLLRRAVLGAGNNATMLVHHEVRLGEATAGLVSSAVPHLGAGTLEHLILVSLNVVFAIFMFLNALNHFNYT